MGQRRLSSSLHRAVSLL
uniref:Uncharacterized protein n=1 Tax=Anguilla anguilla TaxID=7936 RepID=A0A0E9QS35_ANGAN